MNSYEKMNNQVVKYIESIIEQLDQGKPLTEQYCNMIISGLNDLRESQTKKGNAMTETDMSMENLLDEFNEKAEISKELLQKVLLLVSQGKVPAEMDINQLNQSIETLQDKYSLICAFALKSLAKEEVPQQGASVFEYADAVKNSITMRQKNRLKEVRRILDDFVAVQSLVTHYSDALLPYQEKARELLSEITADQVSVECAEEKAVAPKLFLEALNCKDIDSDEGIELLDKLSEYYQQRVQNGLAAGKYYLPIVEDNAQSESAGEQKKENTFGNKEENCGEVQSDLNSGIKEEIEHSTADTTDNKAESTDDSTETGTVEVSEFVKKVLQSDILLTNPGTIGSLSREISPNEDKKISASIFQNDVRKGNEKAIKVILAEADTKGVLSAEFLEVLKGMPEEIASGMLAYLLRKGYLRKYGIDSKGEIYCATNRLRKALTFREAAKMIGVHQKTAREGDERIEDKVTSAACRIAYEKMYLDSIKHYQKADKSSFTDSGSTAADDFVLKIYPSDRSMACEVKVGAFWTKTEECDDFIERLRGIIADEEQIGSIHFASATMNKAKALADIVFGTIEEIKTNNIVLYSFGDNSYYNYSSENKDGESVGKSQSKTERIAENTVDNDRKEERKEEKKETTPAEKNRQSDIKTDDNSLEKNDFPTSDNKTDQNIINENDSIPEDVDLGDEMPDRVFGLINDDKFYAATAYAKAYSRINPKFAMLYSQLSHALNDPMGHCIYTANNIFTLMEQRGDFEDALTVSSAIRTFFSNQVRYDYNIKSLYSGLKDYELLDEYPALSKVVYTLMDFKDRQKKGIDVYADYHSRSEEILDQELRKLQQEAGVFYESFVIGKKKEKASQKRFLETKKLIFSVTSDFGVYIRAIADRDISMQPLALEFLREHFYEMDSAIDEDTLDGDKLWAYITDFWEKAGDAMMYRRHSDLMSHLRSNIISSTTKAVQLLARWCVVVDRINNRTEDEGQTAYRVIRNSLIENIQSAITEVQEGCSKKPVSLSHSAGLKTLVYTLKEVLACINGTSTEYKKKFFYVPFLLTDDLMLDENYFPDLEVYSSEITALLPTTRIVEHARKVQKSKLSYEARLKEILEDKGDDYGQARLIIDYLRDTSSMENLDEVSSNIESGEIYARETADLRKEDFIGELELAQSYGQIDNSVEDKKEKVLQIIDEWYEWANDTANYGFFKKVMDCYLAEIKEEAKAREKDLLEQLNSFKTATLQNLTAEAREKKIRQIQKMIQEQNYTVAEDLLARASIAEDEQEELIEEDFLKDFLDNYDDYYQPVAQRNLSFASLVSNKTRNKEQRGARRLAENWLPGGSNIGKDRLENLLDCFGFQIDFVKSQSQIGKFEHFVVQTKRAKGGQRSNYTHPIAAFGSGAARDGFRVVCINGVYDADALIEIMKQIGNARHTIILYDNALPMSERRRLARKTKNALGDKLFIVIDRTIMMFLVRNYDETKMTRMIMALATPFGYYQPYVWESANVMPPEIFMGRKQELERIKSPTGVNIVYGGRQLGKSALLRKAQEDIDRDENGNRAVLIDIKGLDYKKAANKIAHELFDADVLKQDIETEDWSELARAVKRRLQSDTDRIPYLLLLMDEADTFIDSCAVLNYQPFDALKDIQSTGAGRFKFVIAGLRNIVRFKRQALENNSVLTHLEPMTVKPFNTSEARELLETPLYYLGLRFPKEKESLVTSILAASNYFPGLIQMYCAKLINAMRNKDYANYDEVDTPIYEVSEEHIKKVLADADFREQIREKFIITLKLDEDNYYYLIALLMAFLYHNKGYNVGYTAEDIKGIGTELEIAKIAKLDLNRLESFMEELRELNVLRSTGEKHYLFNRVNFFQMMGTRTEVDDKLEEYMGI